MKKIGGLLGLMLFTATTVNAEGTKPFTGLSFAIGQQAAGGDFTLSDQGSQFSFGKILNVSLSGTPSTYELVYRFPLGDTDLRFGINATLHSGAIGGSRNWSGYGVSATFAVASNQRLSLGAEVGMVLGRQERVYVYSGAGLVATDLNLKGIVETPWGDWADHKEGAAIGTVYQVGIQYQLNEDLSVGLSASLMEFDASKAFGLGSMGAQELGVKLRQNNIGLKISYSF
jgi:opacity protein-like surface antigen